MAFPIIIRHDTEGLARKLKAQASGYPRAASAGINRAAQGALTVAVRAIQKDIGASAQKTIRKNLSLKRATAEEPEAQLIGYSSKKERIPIYEISPRPRTVTKRRPAGGVSYGPQGKRIPGSFIARLKSGHVGVFARRGRERLPMRELFGPSVALVFSRKKITDQVQAFLKEKLPVEIQRAFRKFGE